MVGIRQCSLHWCHNKPCYGLLKFYESKEQDDVTFLPQLTCDHHISDISTYIVYIVTIIEAFSTPNSIIIVNLFLFCRIAISLNAEAALGGKTNQKHNIGEKLSWLMKCCSNHGQLCLIQSGLLCCHLHLCFVVLGPGTCGKTNSWTMHCELGVTKGGLITWVRQIFVYASLSSTMKIKYW